jgi:hypothetical protein
MESGWVEKASAKVVSNVERLDVNGQKEMKQ